ncbi:MAG: hypothetical protein IJF17_08225 [Thermoguttaceae bacterium]|nr:hypothetical protein [Thermoguttaceae bacterium]
MNVFRLNRSRYSLLGIFTCLFLMFMTNVQAEEEASNSVLSTPIPVEDSAPAAQSNSVTAGDSAETPAAPEAQSALKPVSQSQGSFSAGSGVQPVSLVPGNVQVQSVQAIPCECYECCECEVREPRNTLKRNLSATTCFNCRTNGSYKFPVPRQNTYFWPGIYSQKTMTEYVAPYQGLKLRSPSEVFDEGLEKAK